MYKWKIEIEIWPYSTGKGADVDQRNAGNRVNHFEVIADDMKRAYEAATLIQKGIETGPHVWQAPIFSITRVR